MQPPNKRIAHNHFYRGFCPTLFKANLPQMVSCNPQANSFLEGFAYNSHAIHSSEGFACILNTIFMEAPVGVFVWKPFGVAKNHDASHFAKGSACKPLTANQNPHASSFSDGFMRDPNACPCKHLLKLDPPFHTPNPHCYGRLKQTLTV